MNPHARSILGAPCVPSVTDLPEPPDLAVIAVPAASVVEVARECGRRGAGSLVVITAGIDAPAGADLLAVCREHGMRLVGPNCFGVAVPALGLNATFAAEQPPAGSTGLVVQSGGIGMALLRQLARLGIGVSSFASVGDKYDVSSNDMLLWWEQDATTKLAIVHVESFGSPRRFARTARRVGREFPVLTVLAGRSAPGQRAVASHAGRGPATPLITQEALFAQAGIVAADGLGELIDTAAYLASQPLPAGNRVGIVSTAGGAGVLAADACADNDLTVATLAEATQRRLAALLPAAAVVAGPVDTTAAVSNRALRASIGQVAADDGVDVVMVLTARTALGDLVPAILAARSPLVKPLVAAVLDQEQPVRLLPAAADVAVPAYRYPEDAARAVAHAVRYAAWRSREPGQVPVLDGIRHEEARHIVAGFLAGNRLGGWLPQDQAADLLGHYGIGIGPAPGGQVTSPASLMAGVTHEPVFGQLVVLGASGAAGVLADRSARLAPLTDVDADEMIRGAGAAPLIEMCGADVRALAGLLLRVSRLADDFAEIAQLELDPVLARPDGAYPAAAAVRLVPAEPQDPFLRRLR